jgi:hypothetical protein
LSECTSIGIVLADNDKSIIKWLNMLNDNGESPRTWLQAVLLADSLNIDIDIGAVYIAPEKKNMKPSSGKYLMFGDDTVKESRKKNKVNYGWNVRGGNGEFIPGSIFCFNITRPVIFPIIQDICDKHNNVSSYIKALLRKYLKTTSEEASAYIPDNTAIKDLFALHSFKSEKKSAKLPKGNPTSVATRMLDNIPNLDQKTTSESNKNMLEADNTETENKQSIQKKNNKNPLLQYIS